MGNVNCDISKPKIKIQNFLQCDAHHLPFQNNVFDEVASFEVLEHVESPLKMIKECLRVLKVNGLISLSTPNALYIPKVARILIKGNYAEADSHISTWGTRELKNLFRIAGFQKVKIHAETIRDDYNRRRLLARILRNLCFRHELKGRQLLVRAIKGDG